MAEAERTGLLERALWTMSGSVNAGLTIDALRAESFVSLSADTALAAASRGALARDPSAALLFAGAIGDESARANALAIGAIQQLATPQGSPEPWLAKMPWPEGDVRYAGLYEIAAQKMLARGEDRAAIDAFVRNSSKLGPQQKIDLVEQVRNAAVK